MKRIAGILLTGAICLLFPLKSWAMGDVPYQTQTKAANGDIVQTQTAYKPMSLFGSNAIKNPEDIYIDSSNHVYVADSGLKQVIEFDMNGNKIRSFGKGLLEDPTGVFVDHNGDVYAADYGREKVYCFRQSGKLLSTYGKPDSPLFGKHSTFKPQKVAVDRRGNIYVIGEGSTNGIIQLSKEGTFLGYFGVNRTEGSLGSFFMKFITTQQQKNNLLSKVPPAPGNITIDSKGLVYSITSGTDTAVIKKLNIAGGDLLPKDISDDRQLVDITVDSIGDIFTVDSDGLISEYDSSGDLLFSFGGKDDGTNRIGLFKQPTGISVDQYGHLYVADRDRGMIEVFNPTSFSQMVHKGIDLFNQGLYVQSQAYWREVLKMNTMFGLAHNAMGKADYKLEKYDSALQQYKLADDKQGYSDTFYELRHDWMQQNLGWILGLLVIIIILYSVLKRIDRKKHIFNPVRSGITTMKKNGLFRDLLFSLKFLKHPMDSFYYRKYENYLSATAATILYVVMFLEYIFASFQTGFIFNGNAMDHKSLFMIMVIFFGPIALFIISNYLVSTINDGEGSFKDVYIGTIYSMIPYWLFIIPVTLVSKILTLNESFIFNFSMDIIICWSLVNLFIMLKELHGYTVPETIRNVFITLFCMIIIVLVIFILYVLFKQVFDFVYSIIQEVIQRV